MHFNTTRRHWLTAAAATALSPSLMAKAAEQKRPFRIYAITFRGMTDVEKGFEEYFSSRKMPVQIIYRDLNRDATRMAGFLEEIRATKPDLIYAWGTSVTLEVVGPYDGVVRGKHITDIPVVFTLVAAPVQAKIVKELKSSERNVTGVTHVVPTEAQINAMTSYRKFETLGVLYTPTERNSVVVLEEIRRIGRERGFHTVERTFRLDANRKPTADGAADLVRELKEAGAQWLYLSPDSFLGTLAESTIIPAAMSLGLPTFASTEQFDAGGCLVGPGQPLPRGGAVHCAQGRADLDGQGGALGHPGGGAQALLIPDSHARGAPAQAAATAAHAGLCRVDRLRGPARVAVRPAQGRALALNHVTQPAFTAAWGLSGTGSGIR